MERGETVTTTEINLTPRDFKGKSNPDWCAGCGDFGVLNAIQRAVAEMGFRPHDIMTVSGIGCSSNLPGYINTYGMHTLHGRSLAMATGVKMANHEMNVLVTGGDGDGYGIGGNHFTHTARRNTDLTYIVMNNQIYGLTTGQISPTSSIGMTTKSTPFGNVEQPVNPITSAIMNGATFVARAYSGDVRHLSDIIQQGIRHKGFSIIDVFSPCVTFNLTNTHDFFKDRIKKLEDDDHNTSDWKTACEKAMLFGDEIYTGVFYEGDRPSLEDVEPILKDGGPLAYRKLGLEIDDAQKIIDRMR